MKIIGAIALALVAGWYVVDGRYSYSYADSGFVRRVDHRTGEQCTKVTNSSRWVNCH